MILNPVLYPDFLFDENNFCQGEINEFSNPYRPDFNWNY